jgi:hypothetical protein
MKTIVVLPIPLLFVLATASAAQEGPASPSMPCKDVASLVANSGAVVLRTGSQSYNLYVTTSDFCPRAQGIVPAFIQTRDSQACFIGYTCNNQGPPKGDKDSR